MKSGTLKVYAELVRPFTLVAPMIGFFSGAVVASDRFPGAPAFFGACSAALLNAASNVINQYFDLEIDRVNKPGRPLPAGKITSGAALAFGTALYLAAAAVSLCINLRIFVIVLAAALATFFYSAPPLRLKRRPYLSNLTIAIPRGMLLIVAGWSVYRPVSEPAPWFIGGVFALYLLGAASTKDFADVAGDSAHGVRTLPVVLGPEATARVIAPFFWFPFLLIPLGIALGFVKAAALPLALLSAWGFYTARLIRQRPSALALEQNHVSWIHMYLILIVGQAGFALAYLLTR